MIGPYFEELAAKYPGVVFVKVDVDENEALVHKFKIESMPTVMFIRGGTGPEAVKATIKVGFRIFTVKFEISRRPFNTIDR